jgi:hypothetical protein
MREELTLNGSELEWTTNYVHITVLLAQRQNRVKSRL